MDGEQSKTGEVKRANACWKGKSRFLLKFNVVKGRGEMGRWESGLE